MTSPARLSALSFSKRLVMRLISDLHALYLHAQPLGDGEHVLVAATAEIHTRRMSLGSVGASLVTWASACAGSSAGMMPSSLHRSWKAVSASLSVADTYSTRPCSLSQECSGPMPG